MIVYGINPVIEALRAGRVRQLWIAERRDERMRDLLAFAATHHIAAQHVTLDVLARRSRGGVHQGVVADVDDAAQYSVEELIHGAAGVPLIVVLDGIEDPHNLGAILRTADASGASGVVVLARRSAAPPPSSLASSEARSLTEPDDCEPESAAPTSRAAARESIAGDSLRTASEAAVMEVCCVRVLSAVEAAPAPTASPAPPPPAEARTRMTCSGSLGATTT
jgi:hypothetical protein